MKIFSVSQIRAADQFTIQNEPIVSIDLMERAARACYDWFHRNISRNNKIAIYCGKGNNGGDGLALARMLASAGYTYVSVTIIEHSNKASADFKINEKRLKKTSVPIIYLDHVADLEPADVIVDAVLGSGLNSALRGLLADFIDALNKAKALKIAIDIPTGLFADSNLENTTDHIFKADHTFSFQFPKWSFMFPEFGACAGQIHVLDIGLSRQYIQQTETFTYAIDEQMVRGLIPVRQKFDHKGTFGHALIIAGSKGKIGAAILASRAVLRSGAGLVTSYIPKCGLIPLQSANAEIMAITDEGENELANISFELLPDAIGLGPGIGTSNKTRNALQKFISGQDSPMVIDADGLNNIAMEGIIDDLPKNSILTPHLGELDRLLGKSYRGEDMFEPACAFATKHQLILVVKGAHTAIYTPNGQVYFNTSGTNGMATAGSGDVLTGILSGLLAQGLEPIHAAICGVYFHGKAGENAALQKGNAAMTAMDIIHHLKIDL